MMTPLKVAATSREPLGTPGRGKPSAATDEDAFHATLSGVEQDATAPSSATERGATSGGTGPTTARATAAQPLDVDALLAQLATGTPKDGSASATSTSASSRTAKTHKEKLRSGGEDQGARVPIVADASAVGTDLSAIAAATLTPPTVAGQAASVAPPAGAALPAAQSQAQPASAVAEASVASTVDAQATPSMQVTLTEITTHLAPTQAKHEAGLATAGQMASGAGDASSADDVKAADGAGTKDFVAAPALEAASAATTRSAVQQITEAVSSLGAETPNTESGATQALAAKPSPTRSLILHLAPATLGTITVRLHLADGGLSVRLAVEKEATLSLISQARETLQSVLGATYRLDQLTIQGADAASLPNAGSHDATNQPDRGAPADHSAGGRRGNEEAPRRQQPPPPREPRAAGAGRVGGLFV